MQVRNVFLIAVALGWSGAAPAEVYRCEAGGRTQFSDKPCLAGQEPMAVALPNTMETSAGDQALAREYDRETKARRKARAAANAETEKASRARRKTEARILQGQVRNEVVVGMTEDQVGSILGEPSGKRSSESDAGSSQTWTFQKEGVAHTVQFKDGKVASVSRRTAKGK